MEGTSLYVGGVTSDNALRNYTSITSPTPIIMRFIESGEAFTPHWGRTVVIGDDYVLNGIATT